MMSAAEGTLFDRASASFATIAARRDQNPADGNYGYIPTLYVCIIFVTLYSISTLLHLGQALKSRIWYMLFSLVLGGIGEILGWSGRLWSSLNISNLTAFLLQISTTIFSPTFIAVAIFIILGRIIKIVGPQYSRLPPNLYSYIFITIDVIALVIQAVGGGLASSASAPPVGDPNVGGHVMLVGIVIQLAEITVYTTLGAEFFYNIWKRKVVRPQALPSLNMNRDVESNTTAVHTHDEPTQELKPQDSDMSADSKNALVHEKAMSAAHARQGASIIPRNLKIMSSGLAFCTLLLFIRAIYRTIELSNGWNGRIIHTQVYFNVLDGGMITLAMFTLNIIHPMFFLY